MIKIGDAWQFSNTWRLEGYAGIVQKADRDLYQECIAKSQLFGLFTTMLLITSERNSTIRKLKYEDFVPNKVGKGFVVRTYATKTGKG